jgi:lipopolysaccharide cholinephosphotransferase
MNDIRQIQLKCLEILNIVDDICRKNDIKYSLCGGSVVGAYLYSGCLPWDDDIDLMMTRENYNRFLKVASNNLPEGYSIHNYQLSNVFSTLFTKITNNNTTIVQQNGTVSGIFLDITVYDKIPNNWKAKIDIFLWKISQVVFIGKIHGNNLKTKLRNFVLSTLLRDKRRYFKFFQRQVEKLSNCKNYHYSELFGAFCNTKPYDPQIFENYSEISFENKNYMIVRDYIKYLETRYDRTDFHEPKEKQIAPHYKLVDFNKPYKEYIKENSNG